MRRSVLRKLTSRDREGGCGEFREWISCEDSDLINQPSSSLLRIPYSDSSLNFIGICPSCSFAFLLLHARHMHVASIFCLCAKPSLSIPLSSQTVQIHIKTTTEIFKGQFNGITSWKRFFMNGACKYTGRFI